MSYPATSISLLMAEGFALTASVACDGSTAVTASVVSQTTVLEVQCGVRKALKEGTVLVAVAVTAAAIGIQIAPS